MEPRICSMFCFFCCVFFFKFGLRPKVNPPNFWNLSTIMSKATLQDRTSWQCRQVVLSKLSSCCDELGKMDLDDRTIENMCSDMAASMEAVERHEVEISAYQANIRTTSHDMSLLYSGSWDIEVGPLLLKLQHIFWLPKLSASPACGKDFGGWHAWQCVVTQSRGPSNPSFGTGNPHFGPPVFRKRFVLWSVFCSKVWPTSLI